ncbi:MAG: hypothetical protein ACQPRJ_01950 [Solitalea-like symbiont of Acarus siro]
MNLRRILAVCILILALFITSGGCKQDNKPKNEKEKLQDFLIGSWTLDIPSNKDSDSTIIYNFRKENLLIVTVLTNENINKEEYFIPISYNYKEYLNNPKKSDEEIEVGSWRILNDRSLIISHLNQLTQHLNIKTAKIVSYDKSSLKLEETAYIEETDDQGITKIVPKTYSITLKWIL